MRDGFNDYLRVHLKPKGVLIARDGTLTRDPAYAGTDPPKQKDLDYLNESAKMSRIHSRVQVMWARDLSHTIKRLLAGDSTDEHALRAVLYLRLYGLAADFRGDMQRIVKLMGDTAPKRGSIWWFASGVLTSVDKMLAVLNEDEQLWAEYRRSVDAHIWQCAYEMQAGKNGRIRDDMTSKFTGKKYQGPDIRARLDGVVRRYRSEQVIALDFARRLRVPAMHVHTAMRAYCGEE